jgi:hypothetical protein
MGLENGPASTISFVEAAMAGPPVLARTGRADFPTTIARKRRIVK